MVKKHGVEKKRKKEKVCESMDSKEKRGMKMPRLAVFDLDSTLIEEEMIDEFAALAGKGKEVAKLTKKAIKGGRTSATELQGRTKYLKGLSVEAARERARAFHFRKGFKQMAEGLRHHGFRLGVITGAFGIGVRELQKKHEGLEHFDFVACNHLQVRNGKLTGKALANVKGNKREILKKWQKRLGIGKKETFVVGDGAADEKMFPLARVSVSFGFAPPQVKKKASYVVESGDLLDVLKIAEKEF